MKYKKNALSKLFMMLGGALAFSAFAQQFEPQSAKTVGTVVDPKGAVYEKLTVISPPLTRLIIYRLPSSTSQNAAGIEINGHYHTSLQTGSYSELCMPAPTRALISTRLIELEQVVKNDVDATKSLNLKPTQEAYLRVTEISNERAILELVPTETAKKELQQTQRQLHAVSRVPNAGSCALEVGTQMTAKPGYKQVETMVIALDALFEFGKSDTQSILPSGRDSLNKVIDLLQQNYGKHDNVHFEIIGFADPLGNPTSNQSLSESRAKTIHDYFVAGGINSNKLSAEGRGSNSLVVSTCARAITPQSISCNKPNRRVVVNVSTLTQ
jgi:OmpA-OmpF porin, OOP family